MAITIDDFDKIWASTSPLTPYSFGESNYKEGWNFIGSTPPSRQMWDFIQKQNDEKLKYIVDNYLPTAGGTMTGAIVLADGGNPLSTAGGTMTGNIILPNGSKAISEDDIFYKAGDTFTFSDFLPATGFITSGRKEMYASICLPKSLDNITSITCDAIRGGIRIPTGGYVHPDDTDLKSLYTVGIGKLFGGTVRIQFASTNEITSAVNNTPLAFVFNSMSLTFN